ncbi:cyclic AMP response element-binding protein B isoform X4 [Drosophila pseudoobscura]|uniref:Cyclic AMP response element-binding protein B isoform X4 n=1 Tax=Drosophila pseudoobscura pseudoobscura TaxID=46245 RepID=A0A0R3P1L2_DROPS|nr:cyclic AMP response element-binding protein B isoform X4 [Drosophila pseudoobscura]
MDNSIVVEENGNSASSGSLDLITAAAQAAAAQQQSQNPQSTTASAGNTNNSAGTGTVLTTTANCNLQYPMQPLAQHGLQVQSVIQANPSGVIQTAAGTQQHQALAAAATATAMHKGVGVVFVAKPANSTVIHTTASNAVQIPPTFPCKIKPEPNSQHQEDSDESLSDDDSQHHRSELTRRPSYNKIFTEISGPDMSDNSGIAEDQTRKREIRLQKNREAARECRRKKKEYIKCLENRVAVLENQNKALIEELKSLKELYCQTKND